MPSYPWLSLTNTDEKTLCLWTHKISFGDGPLLDNATYPTLISFIGTHQKSQYLASLLGYAQPLEQHGKICVDRGFLAGSKQPTIFLDCEISSAKSRGFQPDHPQGSPRVIEWTRDSRLCFERFSDHLIHHVLAPLSSILCYFATDLKGISGVAQALAYQAVLPRAHNLPLNALPQILIVVETRSKAYNAQKSSKTLREQIVQEMINLKQYTDPEDAVRDLLEKFSTIHVIGIQITSSLKVRTSRLSKHLGRVQEEVLWSRRASRYHFSTRHLGVFSHELVSDFCKQQDCFDFLRRSRPDQFDERQIKGHIDECLALLPGQNWLWQVVVPLLASAFCLASYPPGSHSGCTVPLPLLEFANLRKTFHQTLFSTASLPRLANKALVTIHRTYEHKASSYLLSNRTWKSASVS
jgi:hypothetical protein